MSKHEDLSSWEVCNPDHLQDVLPQPYRLIHEVLSETILHQLNLAMHSTELKKNDPNYEGALREYIAGSTIELQSVCCVSPAAKTHNHLVVGDKAGNVYLLDLAKKVVFSRKELATGCRVISIAETSITDKDSWISCLAVTLHDHHKVYILAYKHTEPKLSLICTVEVGDGASVARQPYQCQFDDYGRNLIVYTYEGSIMLYRLPELVIDCEQAKKSVGVPLQEEEIKKKLKQPFQYAVLNGEVVKINQKMIEIKFQGQKIPLKYADMLSKLMKTSKNEPVPEVKDPKNPKVEVKIEQPKQEMEYNQTIVRRDRVLENGNDNSGSYEIPRFRPYAFMLHCEVELEKKKYFERSKLVRTSRKLVYGWLNTKEFHVGDIDFGSRAPDLPNFMYILEHMQPVPEANLKQKQELYRSAKITNLKQFKNVFAASQVAISRDELLLAVGLADGSICIWNTSNLTLEFTLDRHHSPITALCFFQGWKIISGSQKGEVHIDNLIEERKETRLTNIFESKTDFPISTINVNQLGLAMVLDTGANLRVYDMWRNKKIARISSCNSFSLMEGNGKRWIPLLLSNPSTCVYSNNDFTVAISCNWPSEKHEEPGRITNGTELQQLKLNPWKCRGTNVHVIRNFDFLLSLFQGLENTFKKGYERKKIQNLFTNLEYTQLYDRHFDLPDFGVTDNFIKKDPKFTKSVSSQSKTISQSKALSKSKSKLKATKLTNEMLHPQKFLLQRRKIAVRDVLSEEWLMNKLREEHKKKGRREHQLQNDLSKATF